MSKDPLSVGCRGTTSMKSVTGMSNEIFAQVLQESEPLNLKMNCSASSGTWYDKGRKQVKLQEAMEINHPRMLIALSLVVLTWLLSLEGIDP